MAPRANWKGFLRLSLVTCPVALYPATSDTEKVSFNQINRKTGHRIKYAKVDADTGEEVASEDIIKGYKVDTDTYIEMSKEELDDIALESTHTIEIDEFVPRTDIDSRYLIRPYYLVPDGKVGHDAFAVIRETIRSMNKVAIGRVVLTNREHIIALEPLDKGLMGTLLRYPYEVRSEKEYFDDIQDVKVTKDMLDLARHIVEEVRRVRARQVRGPLRIRADRPHQQKRAGIRLPAKTTPNTGGNVINLMDALKRSLASERQSAPAAKARAKSRRSAVDGQREMLLPISGKRAAKEEAKTQAPKKADKQARAPLGRKRRDSATALTEMPWSAPFDEPIRLPGGRRLTTLQDAADYIMKLPEKLQHQEPWQIAVENLINAAETGGGWMMFARIAVMRALNEEEIAGRYFSDVFIELNLVLSWGPMP